MPFPWKLFKCSWNSLQLEVSNNTWLFGGRPSLLAQVHNHSMIIRGSGIFSSHSLKILNNHHTNKPCSYCLQVYYNFCAVVRWNWCVWATYHTSIIDCQQKQHLFNILNQAYKTCYSLLIHLSNMCDETFIEIDIRHREPSLYNEIAVHCILLSFQLFIYKMYKYM